MRFVPCLQQPAKYSHPALRQLAMVALASCLLLVAACSRYCPACLPWRSPLWGLTTLATLQPSAYCTRLRRVPWWKPTRHLRSCWSTCSGSSSRDATPLLNCALHSSRPVLQGREWQWRHMWSARCDCGVLGTCAQQMWTT